jgi:hypothetical protein
MLGLASFYRVSDYVDNMVLAASVAEDIVKPAGYNSCVFTATEDCWVRRGAAAVIPVADLVDGTGSIFVPRGSARIIDFRGELPSEAVAATVSVISAATPAISLEWFR